MSQMAIMYHMYPMRCMHVLYPHMRYRHGGIYKRGREKGNRVRSLYQEILCTESKLNTNKEILIISLVMLLVSQI